MKKHKGLILFSVGILALLFTAGVLVLLEGTSLAVNASEEALTTVRSAGNDETTEALGDPFVTVVPYGNGITSPEPLATDPKYGTPNAPVTIIEFGDFECTGCAEMHEPLLEVVNEYFDYVQLVWKDFPLPVEHPHAETAAFAARCAQNQDLFWEYHDLLYSNQAEFIFTPWVDFAAQLGADQDAFLSCLENEETRRLVVEGYFIARALEVGITPTLYVNDTILTGVKTADELRAAIDAELEALGITPDLSDDEETTTEEETDTEDVEDEETES